MRNHCHHHEAAAFAVERSFYFLDAIALFGGGGQNVAHILQNVISFSQASWVLPGAFILELPPHDVVDDTIAHSNGLLHPVAASYNPK